MQNLADYIRPSSMAAIEICPGRARMEAAAVAQTPALEQISRPAAEQGTLGHSVVAKLLALTYQGPDGWQEPAVALAQIANLEAGLESWAADGVRRCFAYAVALVDRERKANGGMTPIIVIERHLVGDGVLIVRGGTADLILISTGRIVVVDWKLGFLDQGHAADHLQLATYAVMARDKYGPKNIEVHLAQGRRQEFSSALYSQNDIEAARDRVRVAVAGAKAAHPPLRRDIDACRYCRALTACRQVRDHLEDLEMWGAPGTPIAMLATGRDALADLSTDAGRVELDRLRGVAAAFKDDPLARRFNEETRALQQVWRNAAQAVVA